MSCIARISSNFIGFYFSALYPGKTYCLWTLSSRKLLYCSKFINILRFSSLTCSVWGLSFPLLISDYILTADNGGGMTPDKMRQCMSLGYSEKSKMANTIGQCWWQHFMNIVMVITQNMFYLDLILHFLFQQMEMVLRLVLWGLGRMS